MLIVHYILFCFTCSLFHSFCQVFRASSCVPNILYIDYVAFFVVSVYYFKSFVNVTCAK